MPEEKNTIELPSPPSIETTTHRHTGTDQPKISLKNINDFMEVVSTEPTVTPTSFYNQVKVWVSGSDGTSCIYDYQEKEWKKFGMPTSVTDVESVLTTQGDLLYRNSSSVKRLAAGTSSFVLTSQGAGTNPLWSNWKNHEAGQSPIHLSPDAYQVAQQGSFTLATSGDSIHNVILSTDPGANGDQMDWKVYMGAGTYTLVFYHPTTDAAGIVDVQIDGVEVTSFDLYSGAVTYNVRSEHSGISVTTAGLKTISFVIDGKNGSSSGYRFLYTWAMFYRTA